MEKRFVRKCDPQGSCISVTTIPEKLCSFATDGMSYGDIIVNNIVTGESPGPVISPMSFDTDKDVENLVADLDSDITVSRLDVMAAHINAIRGRKQVQKSQNEASLKEKDSSSKNAPAGESSTAKQAE